MLSAGYNIITTKPHTMEADEILFTCYLVGDGTTYRYRAVPVFYDESKEMFISPYDTILAIADFPHGFASELAPKLLAEFGADKTRMFLQKLLEKGVEEMVKYAEEVEKDPNTEPHPPDQVISNEYKHMYQFLILEYGFHYAYNAILIVLEYGMRLFLARDLQAYEQWIFNSPQ